MKKNLPFSKIRSFVLIIALVILSGGIGYRLGEHGNPLKTSNLFKNQTIVKTEAPTNMTVDFSLFWDVWARLQRYYIDASTIDKQKMVWGAISGMVASLDDPYTSYFPPKQNTEFKEDIGGSFQGIGAQLGIKDQRVIIIAPLKGTPAELAGIKAGDWIAKVNAEETFGWTTEQAVNKIRGPKGTTVTLTILHENATKPIDITIKRDEIVVPSVTTWIKTPGQINEILGNTISPVVKNSTKQVAYIHLTRFGDRTNEEWN